MSECSVKVADVDAELKRLWNGEKDTGKIKACLFNLIIFTQEKRRREYFEEIVHSVIERFPCRILFIQYDSEENNDSLDVSVSNETFEKDGTTVACDQITIKVSGKPIERVPYLVAPNLVPDLPVYLFWGQDPTSDHVIFSALIKYASRLVFDSECTADLQAFSKNMLNDFKTRQLEVMDIHWALISGWRDVLKKVFNSESKVKQLQNCHEIAITYNDLQSEKFHHPKTQALYLACWLAAQLDWCYDAVESEKQKLILKFQNDQGSVNIVFLSDKNTELQCGAVLSLAVQGGEENGYHLIRQESTRKVLVHITSGDTCLLPFTLPLPNLKLGFNFMKEIFYEKTSVHYENMLKILAQISWKNLKDQY